MNGVLDVVNAAVAKLNCAPCTQKEKMAEEQTELRRYGAGLVRAAVARILDALGPLEGGRERPLDHDDHKYIARLCSRIRHPPGPGGLGLTHIELLEALEPLREEAERVANATHWDVLCGRGSERAEIYGELAALGEGRARHAGPDPWSEIRAAWVAASLGLRSRKVGGWLAAARRGAR